MAHGASRAWRARRRDAPDVYAPIQEGWISPGFFESSGRPIWKLLPTAAGAEYAKGATYGEEIRAQLASDDPGVLVLDRDFETQSVDPMFLEPECGLAWYDAGRKKPRARPRRAVAVRGGKRRSPICSARQTRRSGRIASTPSSPMSAAASADAITRRSRSMWRWRRCSSPAARSGSRTIATSNSRAASSGTRSRCGRRSGSTGRAAG